MRVHWSRVFLLVFGLVVIGAVAAEAQNMDRSPWQFRLRGIGILPDEDATIDPIGGAAEIDPAYVPELDISYFLNDNVAVELILATAKHDVAAEGTQLGDVDLGSIWILPPTLTIQYHLMPDGNVRPYIGAGANLTFFYNEDLPAETVTDIDYDTGGGFAIQGGFDIGLDANWMLNVDVKKVFLSTDVTINNGDITAEVDIHPLVVGAGVGYRF